MTSFSGLTRLSLIPLMISEVMSWESPGTSKMLTDLRGTTLWVAGGLVEGQEGERACR